MPTASPERVDLELVYRREYGRLVRLAFSVVGRRSEAEELVQDSFVTAQRNWERVGEYENPGAWLRHVLVNRCISHQRKAGTEAKTVALVASDREPLGIPASEPDEALWKAVRELPRMQAAVVGLLFVDDRSPAQAAAILGCAQDTVRTHLRRAKATLAKKLGTPTDDEPDAHDEPTELPNNDETKGGE